jgi:hypothetical protein
MVVYQTDADISSCFWLCLNHYFYGSIFVELTLKPVMGLLEGKMEVAATDATGFDAYHHVIRVGSGSGMVWMRMSRMPS